MASRIFLYAQQLGLTSPFVIGGASIIGAHQLFTTQVTDAQKEAMTRKYTDLFRSTLVNPKNISEADLRKYVESSHDIAVSQVLASPVFYALYQTNQPIGLRKGLGVREVVRILVPHLARSCSEAVRGTLAAGPLVATLYGIAAVALPVAQNLGMELGLEKKMAEGLSMASIFLFAAPRVELALERMGCGANQPMSRGFTAKAYGAMATRMAAGPLLQYLSVYLGRGEEDKLRDLAFFVAGTTLAQHPLNGFMAATTLPYPKGLTHQEFKKLENQRLRNFILGGDVTGNGNAKMARWRLAGTFVQRLFFGAFWTELTHTHK